MTEQEGKEFKLLLNIKDVAIEQSFIDPKSFTASITTRKMEIALEDWEHRYGTCYDCYGPIEYLNNYVICYGCSEIVCYGCEKDKMCENCYKKEEDY